MMFGDVADKGAADNDAIGKLGHVMSLLWCRNAKPDRDRFFPYLLNGLDIFFDLGEIGKLCAGDAC